MSTSAELFARALQLMPGGVNSPVRAFRSVGGTPFFTKAARGATLSAFDLGPFGNDFPLARAGP